MASAVLDAFVQVGCGFGYHLLQCLIYGLNLDFHCVASKFDVYMDRPVSEFRVGGFIVELRYFEGPSYYLGGFDLGLPVFRYQAVADQIDDFSQRELRFSFQLVRY